MGWRVRSSILLIPVSMLLFNTARLWQLLGSSLGDGGFGLFSVDSSPPGAPSALSATYGESCIHNYSIEILSVDPLIMYINNFLTDEEIHHMLQYSKERFRASPVYNKELETVVDTSSRSSQSAMLPLADPVGVCLAERMKALLGNLQHLATEAVQIVKYEPGDMFNMHMDWFHVPRNASHPQATEMGQEATAAPPRPYNRLASIFAYLGDGCEGGETYFLRVRGVSAAADGTKFARTASGDGLLVRPRRGNAVFWMNLLANGTGDPRVAHAGRPVRRGSKIGINLFSYYYYDEPMLGGDGDGDK